MTTLSLLFLLTACDAHLTDIAVSGHQDITVPGTDLVSSILGDVPLTSFGVAGSQELQNQGVQPKDIDSAVLTDFSLQRLAGDPDLSFLTTVVLSVESNGLAGVQVADCADFPVGQELVPFLVTGAELRDYVTADAMSMGADVTGNRPDSDTDVQMSWTVVVGVTTQGAVSNM